MTKRSLLAQGFCFTLFYGEIEKKHENESNVWIKLQAQQTNKCISSLCHSEQ